MKVNTSEKNKKAVFRSKTQTIKKNSLELKVKQKQKQKQYVKEKKCTAWDQYQNEHDKGKSQ